MRTSIATVSVSGTLPHKLEAIAAAGFDGVEIFENDLVASPLAPEAIRDLAADLGLRIEMYQPMRDVEAMPPDRFEDTLRRAERKFELMDRLGTDLLLVCSNVSPEALDDDDLAAEQLHRLAERAAAHGIRIAYEALAWGRHVNRYLHAWRIVRAADHPNLGTCLDSFHILSRGSDPAGIEAIPGEKIFFLQLADAPRLAMDVLQWSRHHRCFPGQGDFDVAGLVAHVLRAGYTGPLSLEVFNDIFRQAPVERTAVDAMRSLVLLREQLGGQRGPVPPNGFGTVELTGPRKEVEPLLQALGFEQGAGGEGIWSAGRALIAVNDSPLPVHLTAIGLQAPDRDDVVAPDGVTLHFAPTERTASVADDVSLPEQAVRPKTEIECIDHVALTQSRHDFDGAMLFYRAVLGLTPESPAEFADPYGLIRSRAMAAADRSVRLVLNIADVAGTDAPLLQHIAVASTDILATAARLRAAAPGARLPIPANYHDDLEARHDLGAERHRALRDLGLLYDRDEHGEFLHFYTTVCGSVFFEVVQRIDGYRGYGAANAPVRLAAQHAYDAVS